MEKTHSKSRIGQVRTIYCDYATICKNRTIPELIEIPSNKFLSLWRSMCIWTQYKAIVTKI